MRLRSQRASLAFACSLAGVSVLSAAELPNTLVNNPANDTTAQDTQSNSALVLGSGSTLLAVFHDSGSFVNPDGNQLDGIARSTDVGATWTDLGKLPASANGDAGFPVLARDGSNNNIYLCTLGFNSGVQVFRSTDGGATFGAPSGFGTSIDRPWIAVDGAPGICTGSLYLAYASFAVPQGIYKTRSTDGGVTWSAPGSLGAGAASNGANVAVGSDHALYVSWYDPSFNPRRIQMKKSTDCGATFSRAAHGDNPGGDRCQRWLGSSLSYQLLPSSGDQSQRREQDLRRLQRRRRRRGPGQHLFSPVDGRREYLEHVGADQHRRDDHDPVPPFAGRQARRLGTRTDLV